MKRSLLILIFIFSCYYIKSQTPWVKQIGGAGDTHGVSIVDVTGNIYTYGNFTGTSDFDPGTGTYNMTSSGFQDAFLVKLDAAGNFVWAKQIGGDYYETISSIALDASGNIYVTGSFSDTYDFDSGSGVFTMTSAGGDDIFVMKLNASGNFVWAKQIGDMEGDGGNIITLDNQNNILVYGVFTSTVDFDPGSGIQNLTSPSSIVQNSFILKLNNSGNFIWVKQLDGDENHARDMKLDLLNNIFISGSYNPLTDFDTGAGVYNLNNTGGAFISKLDASGNFSWAKQVGSSSYVDATSITLDNLGYIYSTGNYNYTNDFDPNSGVLNLTASGMSDIYILKLDISGNFIWAKSIGGTGYDFASSIVNNQSHIFISGQFRNAVDFDSGSGSTTVSSYGASDAFILNMDSSGNFIGVKNIGGTDEDRTFSVFIGPSNNIYCTGAFIGTCDFNSGSTPYNLNSFGGDACFIYKVSQILSGVNEQEIVKDIFIFPNPTSDILNIKTTGFENTNVQILNSLGQTLINNNCKTQTEKIDIHSLSPGVYFVKISQPNKSQTIKLIKE